MSEHDNDTVETNGRQNTAERVANTDGGTPQEQPAGQAAAPAAQRESMLDIAQRPVSKRYAKYSSALYAIAGVGVGLLVILIGEVGAPMASGGGGSGTSSGGTAGSQVGSGVLSAGFGELINAMLGIYAMLGTPFFALVLSVGVGAYIAADLDADDRTAFTVAGMSTAVGTAVMILLGLFLAASKIAFFSMDYGTLTAGAVGTGVLAGLLGAASAYVQRNLHPAAVDAQQAR